MKRPFSLLATAFFLAVSVLAPTSSVEAQNASPLVLTINDFGADAYVENSISVGNQTWFSYKRNTWESMFSSKWGAYLYGSTLIANDSGKAFQEAPQEILSQWGSHYWVAKAPKVGDESVVYQRLTDWEIQPETPMVESLVVIRQGNAVSTAVFATMGEYDPNAQAQRYANLMLEHLRSSS